MKTEHHAVLFSRGGLGTEAFFYILLIFAVMVIGVFVWKWKDNIRFWTITFRGDRIVGWIVQANDILFEKGDKEDLLPGLVIFSFDDDVGYDEDFMLSIADYLLKLKKEGSNDPDLQKLVKEIKNEKWKKNSVRKLPSSITDGAEVYMAHVLIGRDTLPKMRLTRSYIRIKAMKDDVKQGADHIDYLPTDRVEPFRSRQ